MNPLDALHLQLRLEGKEVVDGDRLRQVETVPDEEMPVMLLAQLADEQVVARYDEAVEPDLYNRLAECVQQIAFPGIDPLLTVLVERDLPVNVGHYKTYTFPPSFVEIMDTEVVAHSSDDPQVQAFGFGGFPGQVYCIEKDARVVSACVSTLENGNCGEVWVYSAEEHRCHGFARRVVSAWAQSMLKAGKVPFYSHKMENNASADLAKRLGLIPLFEEIVLARMNV